MILDRPATSTGGYTSAGGFAISGVLSGLPEGERNDAIFRFCCWLRRQFRDDWHFVLANAAMANARCVPPMSEQELRQCVESAFKQDHDALRSNALLWTQMINTSGGWDDSAAASDQRQLADVPHRGPATAQWRTWRSR